MFASTALLAAVSLYLLAVVGAAPATKRQVASNNDVCQQLVSSCTRAVNKSLSNVFAIQNCVFAATCFGGKDPVDNFLASVYATKSPIGTTPPQSVNLARVTSTVLNAISTDGKSISRQNFVDGFYRQLSASNGPYPTSLDIVISYYNRVAIWTAFCNGNVPFRNFQDYFQYGVSISSNGCAVSTVTFGQIASTPIQIMSIRPGVTTPVISRFIAVSTSKPTPVSSIVVSISKPTPVSSIVISTSKPTPVSSIVISTSKPTPVSSIVISTSKPTPVSSIVISISKPTPISSIVVSISKPTPVSSIPVSISKPTPASSTRVATPTSIVSQPTSAPSEPLTSIVSQPASTSSEPLTSIVSQSPTGTPPTVSSDPTCQKIFLTCVDQVNSSVTNLFAIKSCVLGAACATGSHPVAGFASAVQTWKSSGSAPIAPLNQPRVSTALFNAGSTDGGKTWTQQNFIDAYYSQLSAVGGPYPPNVNVVIDYFIHIAAWTGFCGKGVPYQNFADYFQYSATVNGPVTTC